MARRRFGADLTAVVWRTLSLSGVDGVLQLAAGQSGITVWTLQSGGTQVTDLLNAAGTAVTTLTADANGELDFSGPATTPETVALWLEAVPGSRQLITASDLGPQVQSLASSLAATAAQASTLDTRTTTLETRSTLQPLWIVYGTGTPPLRTTVTSDTTRPVQWYGTAAPTVATNGAGGAAVDGLDVWLRY